MQRHRTTVTGQHLAAPTAAMYADEHDVKHADGCR
jgi:hypothetical protein